MWASRFWCDRYWAPRFWAKVGADPVTPTGRASSAIPDSAFSYSAFLSSAIPNSAF